MDIRIPVNDRIHLSEILPTDAPNFVKHLNQDKDIYDRTLRIPYPYTQNDADWFINRTEEETAKYGHPVNFAIRISKTLELIGGVGFTTITPTKGSAEMGYWLAKPYWGQGIMTTVVRCICEFAVTQWNLERVQAQVFDTNNASARVLEKNGFVFQTVLRQHVEKNGQLRDVKLYEWKRS